MTRTPVGEQPIRSNYSLLYRKDRMATAKKANVCFLAILIVCLSVVWPAIAADRIPGDINGEGTVDSSDFLLLAGNFERRGLHPLQNHLTRSFAVDWMGFTGV